MNERRHTWGERPAGPHRRAPGTSGAGLGNLLVASVLLAEALTLQ